MRSAICLLVLLAGSAQAQPWSTWVGEYSGPLVWRGCITPGANRAMVSLDATDGALTIDLTAVGGGLRALSLVEDPHGTLSAQQGDVSVKVAPGKTAIALAVELDSGCTVRGQLTRAKSVVPACDRLVALGRIESRCSKAQLPAAAVASRKYTRKDAPVCRAHADALEIALIDVGCMPVDMPAEVGLQCRQLADEAHQVMRCPDAPPELALLAGQLLTAVRATADPVQGAVAEQACRRAHDALAQVADQFRCSR